MSNNKDIVWPPQTTQDVINLTPRKNKHAYSMANPPPSPSPLRKSTGPPRLNGGPSDDDGESTDEEDEEVLKLKLQRIEAKLKLKKLQKQQQKKKQAEAAEKKPEAAIEVPASPAAARVAAVAQAPPSPKSPSRVLLGIDRGLTGKDVSLRRAPQYRKQPAQTARAPSPPRPAKTFSQRLAEERAREKSKFEKQKTVAQSRSKGFGLKNEAASGSVSTSAAQRATSSFTEVLSKYDRTQTVPPPPQATSQSFSAAFSSFARPTSRVGSSGRDSASRESSLETLPLRPSSAPAAPPVSESTDEAGFDSFSGLHLLRRTTPHPTVTRHLAQKTIFQLPQLLKTVVSPKYDPPEVEGDWVVVGTICSKSDPRNVGQNTGAKETGKKYMVMQLTDLKWEIELFLFGAGFDRFWKVPVGTVVALLNPGVMKPRNQDSGRFSLTIADNADDCVLEIGLARDLGFCRSMKRDGKECGTWIDKRHTAFCAFHVEQTVKKARVSRAEVNSMTSLFSPPKKNGSVKPRKFLGGRHGRTQSRDDGLLQEGPIADLPQRLGGAGGNIFVAPGRSTAALLDDEDYLAGNFRLAGGTKEDRLHRRLEEGKRERELTKRIIEAQGREGGLGTQYLRTRLGEADKERGETQATHQRKQASEMISSLRSGAAARDIRLSPIKRKRTAAEAAPTVVKKTRFVLPPPTVDDDDDDLDIVRE